MLAGIEAANMFDSLVSNGTLSFQIVFSFKMYSLVFKAVFFSFRLYWADKNRIEFSFTDGRDRATLVGTDLKAVIGLAVFGQRLFWADARTEGGLIAAVNKNGPSRRKTIQSRVGSLRDLTSVVTLDEIALSELHGTIAIGLRARQSCT